MGFWKKVELHVTDKYVSRQVQGMKMGADLTRSAPGAVQVAGLIGGAVAGTVVGAFNVWSPLSIADTVLTPEAELEERLDRRMAHLDRDA
jgi:hypothetical protein